MKKIIRIAIEASPVIIFLFLLDYVSNNLREVKNTIGEVQSYESNDTVMSQILNDIASNNTLLLLIVILLVPIFIGIMIIIERLSTNRTLLEGLKREIAENKGQTTELQIEENVAGKQTPSNQTEYMPK